jgi:hypothetical protein
MRKPMTAEKLTKLRRILPQDIGLIERVVNDFADEESKSNALRGFLVTLFDEQGINVRKDLSNDAAGWSDGWDWALKYGVKTKSK